MVKIPVKTPKDNEYDAATPVDDHTSRGGAETPPSEPADAATAPIDSAPEPAESEPPVAELIQEGSDLREIPASEADRIEEPDATAEAQEPEEGGELDEVAVLTQKLRAKEQEATDQYDARLRLQAELDNFKKRKEKELADFRKYATSSLVEDILTVMDDFERAIAAAEQTHKLEDFLQGIEMIVTKFLGMLQKKGVKEVEAAPGQPFDPTMHEAVTQIETDDIPEGAIAIVFQKGYYLHDRILRAPKVGVAKPKD